MEVLVLKNIFILLIILFWQQSICLGYKIFKSKFNKLRYITLRDDAFCEAYQEFKENNCIAKLTYCSPLNDDQIMKMRQILCGPKFNSEVQPPPHIHQPPAQAENMTDPFLIPDYPPPYYLDIHPAQPHSFPWMAAIYNPNREFICTGALVSPRTVITSAQCVTSADSSPESSPPGDNSSPNGNTPPEGNVPPESNPPSESSSAPESEQLQQTTTSAPSAPSPSPSSASNGKFFVRFGRHNLNVSSMYDKAYEYDVESIEISKQFDPKNLESDFAILKLVSPVCNFPPIALPKKDDWENGYYFGDRAAVVYAGWGLGHFQKPYLRSLTSHLLPKNACAKKFNWPLDQLSNNHLCVSPPINVCVGGAGTPVVAYSPHHCVLLGIMSLGDHCNTPKLPLVFTKVSTFMDEISRFIEDDFTSLMNDTSPMHECLYPKYNYANYQPYYFYPSHHQYKHEDIDDDKHDYGSKSFKY